MRRLFSLLAAASMARPATGQSFDEAARTNQNFLRRTPGELPRIITIGTIGTHNQYETPGTVEVSMSFPG